MFDKKIDELQSLSFDEIYNEFLIADRMIEYYDAVKKEAARRALAGDEFSGFNLKSKSSARKFINEALLFEKAKAFNIELKDLHELVLLSPAKVNKKFKDNKEFLESLNDNLTESTTSYYLMKAKGAINEKEN